MGKTLKSGQRWNSCGVIPLLEAEDGILSQEELGKDTDFDVCWNCDANCELFSSCYDDLVAGGCNKLPHLADAMAFLWRHALLAFVSLTKKLTPVVDRGPFVSAMRSVVTSKGTGTKTTTLGLSWTTYTDASASWLPSRPAFACTHQSCCTREDPTPIRNFELLALQEGLPSDANHQNLHAPHRS